MRWLQCRRRRTSVANPKDSVCRCSTWFCLLLSFGVCIDHVIAANPPPPVLDGSSAEFGEVPKVPAGMPVFPTQDALDLSPEQLVRASLPWQGMDTPWRSPGGAGAVGNAWRLSKVARTNFARREPWDVDSDVNQDAPFDNSQDAPVAGHPPPYYIGDGDFDQNKKMNDPSWTRVVLAPPLLPNGPAQYGHGYKPPGYYPNPFNRKDATFLELGSRMRQRLSHGALRPHGRHNLRGSSAENRGLAAAAALPLALLQTRESSPATAEDPGDFNAIYRDGFPGVVGAPAEFDPSNPSQTTPSMGPAAPKLARTQDLYYRNYDTSLAHNFMGNAGDPHDMMMPPLNVITGGPFRYAADPKGLIVALHYANSGGKKALLAHASDPIPVSMYPDDMPPAYAAGGLYPPKPPKPMFGGSDGPDDRLGGSGSSQQGPTFGGGPTPSFFGSAAAPAYAPM